MGCALLIFRRGCGMFGGSLRRKGMSKVKTEKEDEREVMLE